MNAQRVPIYLALSMFLTSSTVLCGDGVIEINMARVKAGGVTASDAPGFSVTLDQPGSYRFTGNLDLRNETLPQNVRPIRVDAGDVTIDFNGFEIIGNVTCPSGPQNCSPRLGVWGPAQTANNLTLRNGTIRGLGRRGVQINTGDGTVVENMRIFENWDNGVNLGDHCLIRNSQFALNGNLAINAFSGSMAVANTLEANGETAAA